MGQRKIKVRAYSYKWDKMIYHGVDGYTIDVMNQTAWLDSACDQSVVLMQFIGLHDNNGEEVYEGEIFANKNRSDEDNIYVCEYDNSQASFVFTSPFDGECLEQNDYVSDLIKIGNVYENEDLLE